MPPVAISSTPYFVTQFAGEVHEAGLVGDAEQGTADRTEHGSFRVLKLARCSSLALLRYSSARQDGSHRWIACRRGLLAASDPIRRPPGRSRALAFP